MYLAPGWANMYLKLNINTGEITVWQPRFDTDEGEKEILTNEKSTFLYDQQNESGDDFQLYSYTKHKLYRTDNIEMAEFKEIELEFDIEELRTHEVGFCECSGSLRYACIENSFNMLDGFLDGKVVGGQFDRNKQLKAYREIAVNHDGNCGQKLHEFIMKRKQ